MNSGSKLASVREPPLPPSPSRISSSVNGYPNEQASTIADGKVDLA